MNKFKILYVCVGMALLTLKIPVLAQDNDQGDYIVLHAGDTLYGNVEYIKEKWASSEFYKKIRLTTVDGKTKKYKKKNISAFRVSNSSSKLFG